MVAAAAGKGLTVLEGDRTQVTVSSDNQAPQDNPGVERETKVDYLSLWWGGHVCATTGSCQTQSQTEPQL